MSVWSEFNAIPNGTKVFNHGFDQCVALANHWNESFMGHPFVPVASAYQWWTQYDMYPQLRNYFVRSGSPRAGAMFIARYGKYDAPNGHIGVVTAVHGDGTFDTMEQNAESNRYVYRYRRGMANMLGFLVPNNNPADAEAPAPKKKGKKMVFDLFLTGPTAQKPNVNWRILLPYGVFHIPNTQLALLLLRRYNAMLSAVPTDNVQKLGEQMLDAEADILNQFFKACSQSAETKVVLDPAKYNAAINEELQKAVKSGLADGLKGLDFGDNVIVSGDSLEAFSKIVEDATRRVMNAMAKAASNA